MSGLAARQATDRPEAGPGGAAGPGCAVASGAEIFLPGAREAALYEVMAGCCFLYLRLPDRKRQILHFALPGDVVDSHPIGDLPSGYGLTAAEPSVLNTIAKARLRQLAGDAPRAALALWRRAEETRDLALDRLQCLPAETVDQRVAHLLLELCVRRAPAWPVETGRGPAIRVSQTWIADATGVSREHVSRAMSRLVRAGILGHEDGGLSVFDPDGLGAVAGLERRTIDLWRSRRATAEGPAERYGLRRLEGVGIAASY